MLSKCKLAASLVLILFVATSLRLVIVPTVNAAVLYDSGNPTAAEQRVLEYINRARSDPVAEGRRLGIDIHEDLPDPTLVGPRPPLAMNKILLGIATAHSQDMYTRNYFSHNDLNGTAAFDRITHAGYNYVRVGENMAAAGNEMSAAGLEDFMMVDAGTQGRPHRVNLLDLINSYPCGAAPCTFYEVGIGYYDGTVPNSDGLTSLITQDFGAAPNTGPFLLGVVYNDKNNNNFYDIGEGMVGVTITSSAGGYYAISSSSGGYAFPIGTSGTITVTASGPGFGPITKTVTLTGSNVKLDFTSQTSSSQTSSQSITPTLPLPVIFQSTPSSFVGTTTPGTITACGSTYTNTQSVSGCGNSFTAIANLPTPSAGWQFNHWTWTGGITCTNNSANPVTCSVSAQGGSLMAVYGAQVNVVTNPASSALISWGPCSNSVQGNGGLFFSTSYGASTVTACYVPSGYTLSYWSCLGGLTCSGSNNSTNIAFTGPGTIKLNLQAQTLTHSTSTTTVVLPSTVSSTASSTASTLTAITSTHSIPEFGVGQTLMIVTMIAISILLLKRTHDCKCEDNFRRHNSRTSYLHNSITYRRSCD
ncbi:MAG: hypothetical protein ABSF09_10975 [Candidatus Bathyarchaeia archaeon]